MIAFLGLGANLGDPEAQLVDAVRRLDRVPDIRVRRLSPAYRSAAHGPPQPDYVNAVLELDTALAPQRLLAAALQVEQAIGRRRTGDRWGPRPIDIDLLLFEGVVLQGAAASPALAVPHPRIAERRFVLRPLSDLDPGLVHPVLGRTVAALLAACPDAPLLDGPWTLPRTVAAARADHGGDVALRVCGADPADLVVQAAHGLVATIASRERLREFERREASVPLPAPPERLSRAELAEALVEALTELLVWLDADGWLPARVTAELEERALRLAAFGQRVRGTDVPIERVPKAVTRHALRVVRRGRGPTPWRAHLVIDL
ncbi:MAG: 2-amino-4-hydroxy-6-hydroxymethyldihydropteridine diphosphokinase [Deltaproteobacteria bacterium]|nr:2-amino-4-hydroxy-6-hydroxymethyldihydropteridine diphosphokinase [Deltaproteobacteria bacterium]